MAMGKGGSRERVQEAVETERMERFRVCQS